MTKIGELFWTILLLLEAAVWLAVAWLATLVFPFRWVANLLGDKMAESPPIDDRAAVASRVAWGLSMASRYTPWPTKCLVQAIAGKAMLRRRGLSSTLYLGFAKDEQGEFKARHAWLRCGSRTVSGGGAAEFTVLATFAELSMDASGCWLSDARKPQPVVEDSLEA